LRAERRLRYYAVPWVRASVEAKLRALVGIGEREFRRYFEVRDLEEGRWNDLGGLEVRPTMSPHPVETTVFRFRARDGDAYRSYAHLADLASFAVLDSMVVGDPAKPGISAELAARTKAAYLEVADVKKVDVGGGMIHGSAADFALDGSGRLLLSHSSSPIGERDRGRASVASFGEEDVLLARGPEGRTATVASAVPRAVSDDALRDLDEIAAFLRWNPPFSELSTPALAEIAEKVRLELVPDGQSLCSDGKAAICLIVKGRAQVLSGGRSVGNLGPGDVFGEEGILVEGCCVFEATAAGPVEVYRIPSEAIVEKPILLWRLREVLDGRFAEVKAVFDFTWRSCYSVGEPGLDEQHHRLFGLIGGLDAAISGPESCPDFGDLITELADFAALHFATEEGFMRSGGYPDLAAHAREHEALLRDTAVYRERYDCGDQGALADLDGFLKDWALKHTLLIDRQYIPFMPLALASRL
jgi:hemerythrin-like metal-binding protein